MSLQQVASSLTEMTVCSRVFQTAFTKLQVFLSYATAENFANAIMMCEQKGLLFLGGAFVCLLACGRRLLRYVRGLWTYMGDMKW